jgi:hypothetical protein
MSDPTELPGEVRRLLAGPVDSLEKMEVLRLCWEDPAKVWTIADARDRLRLPVDLVMTACNDLTDAGFLAGVGQGYRFAPTGPDAAASAQLCRLYDGDRLLVIREMTALAMDRIRNSAARAFSDAFRIRRRDPGKGGSDA